MPRSPNSLRRCAGALLLVALAFLGGCASQPEGPRLVGKHRCESVFIYSVCVADRNVDGVVDYIYFGDDFQVFMYTGAMEAKLRRVERFHACAVRMSDSTRDLSSRLLYSEDLGLTERLSIKGKLLQNYRAAQPAVDACNAAQGVENVPLPGEMEDDPFLADDDWEGDWDGEWEIEGSPQS